VQTRNGNRSPDAAPNGVYSCEGNDRWIAIAVTTDQEFRSFCRIIGDPDWTKDPKFQTLMDRKKNEDELDAYVEEWTQSRSAEEVMKMMQQGGVPAAVVQNAEDLAKDPQMKHRDHFKELKHEVIGPHRYDSVLFKLSKSSQGPRWAGPILGQHIEKVCTDFLGMSLDEVSDCMAEGVFE
jgi:benzylsuccinate CoA-transferase BbsF subunit